MALCKEMFWVRGRSHCKHKYKCQCAFSWQKKEPTKPSTSRLIKAVFFLEKQMCVSRDIANHMAPTQGNTLRWIQFLLILLGDPQNIKNEAKASSQHKSSGGTLKSKWEAQGQALMRQHTWRDHTQVRNTQHLWTHTSVSLAVRVWEHHSYLQAFPRYVLQYHQVFGTTTFLF